MSVKMVDFISAVRNYLDEEGKDINCLFLDGVVSKDTFYKYKQRNPSLQTLIKVANYLQVSIDYLYENTDTNNFVKYSTNQSKFYEYLTEFIKKAKISNRQFCKEMNYQKDIILRYKNGVEPSVRTLFEITNYFGCLVDDLLTKEKDTENKNRN